MSDSEGSDADVLEVMEPGEVSAMGLIDKNMAAVFLRSYGPIVAIAEVEEFLGMFGVNCGTAHRLLKCFVSDEEVVVDPFTFQAMFHNLFPSNVFDRHIVFQRSMSCSRCPRCSKLRQSFYFICTDGESISTNCFVCRKQDPCNISRLVYMRFELPIADDITTEQIENWVERACRVVVHCARELDMPYKLCFAYTKPTRGGTVSISLGQAKARLLRVLKILSDVEGYNYTSIGTPGNRLRFRCCQEKLGRTSATTGSDESGAKRRRRQKHRVEECHGSIDITLNDGRLYSLTASHKTTHESDRIKYAVGPELSKQISDLAMSGLSPAHIIQKLRAEGHLHLKWSAIHYRWLEAVKRNYVSHDDHFISASTYAKKACNLDTLMDQSSPFAVAVTTTIGEYVLSKFNCSEVFIDSTYKTNRSKLELFAVIVSAFGVGFPIAYLLLEQPRDDQKRMDVLQAFLTCLKTRFSTLNPTVFFTDKDKGQMHAIHSVFGLVPSLCYWNMKRAVKRRVQKFRTTSALKMSEDEEKALLSVLSRHFNIHPSFCGKTIEHISSAAREEIRSLFDNERFEPLYEYLMTNWYGIDGKLFYTWGRRLDNYIPFARTTMFVEGHWSSLKRNYLIYRNRPRVDFLLYIIDTKLLPKFHGHFSLLYNGDHTPDWYKAILKEWYKKKEREFSGSSYHTDFKRWACTCASFYMSKFLICKHLIANRDLPFCRELRRNPHPSFWVFEKEKDRLYPVIELPRSEQAVLNNQCPFLACGEERDIESDMPLPLPERTTDEAIEDITADLNCLLGWFTNHVQNSSTDGAGGAQLKYLHNSLAPRLKQYRDNVMRDMNRNTQPQTWGNRDTNFLP